MDVPDQEAHSRRTVLRGLGVTMALPLLDAMVAGGDRVRQDGGGAAQDAAVGDRDGARLRRRHRSSASARTCGRRREVGTRVRPERRARSAPLEPFRDYLTIVSNTDVPQRRSVLAAGNRRRSLPLERGVPDAVASEEDAGLGRARRHLARSAVRAAVRAGHGDSVDAAVASRTVDQSGGCAYGYSCVYTDSISWATPEQPLPMIRDPRAIFDSAVRRRRDAGRARAEPPHRQEHPRLGHRGSVAPAARTSAPSRSRSASNQYLDRHPRDRAPHPEDRSAEQQRRSARAAGRAGRRARSISPSTSS